VVTATYNTEKKKIEREEKENLLFEKNKGEVFLRFSE